MNNEARVAVVLAILLALAGCSREQSDWRSAREADTIESYEQFVARHPEGELAAQARTRSAELAEERDWRRVAAADSLDGYRQFLAQHPNGKWAREAQIRVENFALTAPSPAGSPAPPPVAAGGASPPAPPPPPGPGGPATASPPKGATKVAHAAHVIQLGAFGSRARANAEWTRLKQAFPQDFGALQPRVTAAPSSAAPRYRLQVAVADAPRARTLCARLKARGHACIVVAH